MADILIRGMEMPKDKISICAFINYDGKVLFADQYWEKQNDQWSIFHQTTAIELPPHGRLIDADALLKNVKLLNVHYSYREVVESKDIYAMPTIIPADKEIEE